MSDSSITDRWSSPEDDLPPRMRWPERYAKAERMADAVMNRIEAEVKPLRNLEVDLNKEKTGVLVDAFRWILPPRVLALTKLPDRLEKARASVKTAQDNLRAAKRGAPIPLEHPDWTRDNLIEACEMDIRDAQETVAGLEFWIEAINAGISGGIRGWGFGKDDLEFISAMGTIGVVMNHLMPEAMRAFGITFWKKLPDGTRVPFDPSA